MAIASSKYMMKELLMIFQLKQILRNEEFEVTRLNKYENLIKK
jgi:hypothetical protein